MATPFEASQTVEDLIKTLCLQQYYPAKLSIKELYEITELSLTETENITQQTISSIFIDRITRCNYQARNLKTTSKKTATEYEGYLERRKNRTSDIAIKCHPMDVVVAVFLCCDPIAKQDLVKFMWGCKLSIPFILSSETGSPIIYKWPLRSLVSQWQEQGDKTANEYPVIKYPMQKVGFIRIGELDESKSALINGIIGGSEKAHPMFFHRDSDGSKKFRSKIVHGLVELGWYFPKGSDTDRFHQCIAFANLRGDALLHKEQMILLMKTMDIIVIISNSCYIPEACKTFRIAITESRKAILVLTDKAIEKKADANIEMLLESIGTYEDDSFEVVPLEDKRLAEKVAFVSHHIELKLQKKCKSIDDTFDDENMLNAFVDEKFSGDIEKGIYYANRIVSMVDDKKVKNRKASLMPFQGDVWKQWTEKEIEMHRLDHFRQTDSEQDILSYRDLIEKQKIDLRQQQLALLANLPTVTKYFISCLKNLPQAILQIFLRSLCLGLDEISRALLRPYYKRYQAIIQQKMNADTTKSDQLNKELDSLDIEKSAMSLGLENFTRELGQVFEACFFQDDDIKIPLIKSEWIEPTQLPTLAAKVLMHGYPIEIMDGDVGFFPEMWVKKVLQALRKLLKSKSSSPEPRLHVISVLGIQSTGKSTLLNTLFGFQFAVSAGRCTKGVFMQIVQVSKYIRDKFRYDYVLAIDTEGLRAAQLSSQNSIRFDNKLSCFAIGLADTTIVNLMGENATYLEENLPIVVHAFLRMDMIGLQPRCIIVHHNVDKRNKDKLMEQGRLLENVLNNLTAKACDIEGIVPHKRFKDIIDFDIGDHTAYIPSLLEGEQPMGPISIGYSMECNNLRRKVLANSEMWTRCLTISQFANYLEDLWSAIKKDQFVFEFRTTLETETRIQLDQFYFQICHTLLESISDIGRNAYEQVQSYKGMSEFDRIVQETINDTQHLITSVGKDQRTKLMQYLENPNKLYASVLSQWKDDMLRRFDSVIEDARGDCLQQLKEIRSDEFSRQDRLLSQCIKEEQLSCLESIVEREMASQAAVDKEELTESIWRSWHKLMQPTECVRKLSGEPEKKIETDVETLLYELFSSDKYLIEKAIGSKRTLTDRSLSEFVVLDKHVQKSSIFRSHSKTKEDVTKIANIVQEKIEQELYHILSDKRPYSKSNVRRILLEVKTLLERNKKRFTQDFKIDICIHASSRIAQTLSHMNENQVKDNEKHFLEEKDYIRSLIELKIQQKEQLVLNKCAEEIQSLLIKGIMQELIKQLPLSFKSLQLFSLSKQQCINYLLARALETGDYKSIDLYLIDPETAVLHMLTHCIHIDIIKSEAEAEFKRRIVVVSQRVEKSRQSFEKDLVTNYFIYVDKRWRKKLILQLMMSPKPNSSAIKHLSVQKLNTPISKKWIIELNKEIEMRSAQIKNDIANNFIDKYFGCCERCPFCDEICLYMNKDHAGPHQTHMHRPIGCTGYHYKTTKELCMDICSSLVASNKKVEVDGAYIRFKDYQKSFPDWKIQSSYSLEASAIWKWYFAHRYDKLPYWGVVLKIPVSWSSVSKHKALKYLKEQSEDEN